MTFAVLATGPSMSQAVADSVRHLRCIAVNDAFRLAPWAEALVAQDPNWWYENPEAFEFKGARYSSVAFRSVYNIYYGDGISTESPSGLFGIHVAIQLGAKRVILLGFDMRGSHYFGAHKAPLTNTTPERFEVFKGAFAAYPLRGVEVLNCTAGSALTCYPMVDLADALAGAESTA